jgi:hypothetical protein
MMLLGAVLSMLLALGLIRGIDRLDSSVKAVAEAEMLAGATVIGLVALDDSPDARAIEPASRLGKLLHHPARSIAAFSVLAVLFGAYVQAVGRSAAREDLRPGQVKQAARRSTWSPVRADGDAGARAAGSPVEIVPAAEAVHEVAIDSVVADPMAAEDMATGEASAVTPDAIEAKPIEIQNTVVVIEQGATMYSLLRHFYGAYSAEHLERVRSANPWLQDPAHIPAGLTLHLPATGDGDGPGNVSIPRQP